MKGLIRATERPCDWKVGTEPPPPHTSFQLDPYFYFRFGLNIFALHEFSSNDKIYIVCICYIYNFIFIYNSRYFSNFAWKRCLAAKSSSKVQRTIIGAYLKISRHPWVIVIFIFVPYLLNMIVKTLIWIPCHVN